jgi:hypothetical protein
MEMLRTIHDGTDLAWPLLPEVMSRRNDNNLVDVPSRSPSVLLPNDETRYQLKLVRELSTIKADLFAGHANAVAASRGGVRNSICPGWFIIEPATCR